MALAPVFVHIVHYDDQNLMDEAGVFEVCDSTIAVLNPAQEQAWLVRFAELANADDAQDYCEFGTMTAIFDTNGTRLTVVSDSGGELAAGEFEQFCDENGVAWQAIVDGLDCTGLDASEIYTGQSIDDPALLALVHQIYNPGQ